jgi:hypothetical protein
MVGLRSFLGVPGFFGRYGFVANFAARPELD